MNKKAFTLVEMMVVVMIFTVVIAGIYSTFIVGNKAWIHYNDAVVIKKEARRALFELVRDLRDAENIKVIQSPDASALHFHQPKVGKVTYTWSSQGDNANKLIRRSRLDVRTVARHISTLSFQNLKSTVTVNITAGKQTSAGDFTQVVLREKVAIRSKTTMFQ